MKVTLWLKESSEPMEYTGVINSYTKGDLFCVYLKNEKVHKFPINTIFKIVEDYGTHAEGSVRSRDVFNSQVGDPEVESVTITQRYKNE